MTDNGNQGIDVPPPEVPYVQVFKFRPVNKYTLDSLIKKQLYFSSPSELNDPYDCQVDIDQAIRTAINETEGQQRAQLELLAKEGGVLALLRSTIDQSGVCSCSDNLLNPVMWSHYADSHRGIGLYYKIPERFILDNSMGMSAVTYGDSLLSEWFKTCTIKLDSDFAFEIMKKVVTVKGKDWSYENEVRLVRDHCGGIDIDPGYLHEISFGLRTPDHDKDLIREIIFGKYPNCKFVQIKKGDADFGLTAVGG